MDKFADRLEALGELSKEELETLQQDIRAEFKTVSEQDRSAESVDAMTELANANRTIKGEIEARVAQEAELAARADEAIAEMSDEAEGENAEEGETAEEAGPSITQADPDAVEENEKLAEEEENGDAEVVRATDEDSEEDDEKLNEANSASVPVHTSDSDTSEEEKERLLKQEAKEGMKDEDPEDFKAAKQAPNPEDPEKVAEDAKKGTKAATSVDSPEEAEAATSKEIPEEEQEQIIEEEKTKINEASNDENITREDETVTASANIEVPEDRKPSASTYAPRTIVAGSDLPGITAGSELPDLKSVAQALLQRKNGMGRTSGGDGEKHTVASFHTEFAEDRKLSMTDIEGNRSRMQSASSEAITAAGGLYGPVDTKYDLYGLGHASRPVRDSLPVFNAERGGIRFLTPPVMSDLAGAVGLWTLQDDIDAATAGSPEPTKPCLRIKAGEEVTVYLDAVTLCLTFGNLGARAFPELVERHTELAMIWHARFAETRLLTRIGNLSTKVTAAAELGAARDIFVQVEQAAAAYRSRHRMGENDKLHAIFPHWFKNALRADLTKQAPGDGRETTFELADSKIATWFNVRGINVTWTLEGESGQVFGPQTEGTAGAGTDGVEGNADDTYTPAALDGFPTSLVWYIFSEGTFVFLDGGTLDLGLVRDSTLNGTNDYQIFLETFEGVAKVGIESLRVESQLRLVGSASALTAINA